MLARRMGRKVVTLDLRRVRKQKNIDGTPFAPRKDKRNRRRLLEAIHRNIVVYGQDDGAKVTYRGKYAEFAFQQQFGVGRPRAVTGILTMALRLRAGRQGLWFFSATVEAAKGGAGAV